MNWRFKTRGCVLIGCLAFVAFSTGCMSSRFTDYKRSFDSRPPMYPFDDPCACKGECTYFGIVEIDGMRYYRYDLMDLYRWKRELSSMSYMIPVADQDAHALVILGLAPTFQTNHNCRFMFVPRGAKMDVALQLKTYEREWKYHLQWHPTIIMIEATPSGKGTKINLIERTQSKAGTIWVTSRKCVVDEVLHRYPWWVATLPLAYVVIVPLDVITSPIQAPYWLAAYLRNAPMSPR